MQDARFGALLNYCSVLHTLHLGDEYARLLPQLLRSASTAAAVTQLLLHGLAVGAVAAQAGRPEAWQLPHTYLQMLGWRVDGPAAAARLLGTSLHGSVDAPPRPLPQLLANVVAVLPRNQLITAPTGLALTRSSWIALRSSPACTAKQCGRLLPAATRLCTCILQTGMLWQAAPSWAHCCSRRLPPWRSWVTAPRGCEAARLRRNCWQPCACCSTGARPAARLRSWGGGVSLSAAAGSSWPLQQPSHSCRSSCGRTLHCTLSTSTTALL